MLLITDINSDSLLLVNGDSVLSMIRFPVHPAYNTYILKGVVSRKKQIITLHFVGAKKPRNQILIRTENLYIISFTNTRKNKNASKSSPKDIV